MFEETATIEKLAALAGTNVLVKHRYACQLGRIICVDLQAHQDPSNYKVIEFRPEVESFSSYWSASERSFLLQP